MGCQREYYFSLLVVAWPTMYISYYLHIKVHQNKIRGIHSKMLSSYLAFKK